MPTYKNTTISLSPTFVRIPEPFSQLEGTEGKEVENKIEQLLLPGNPENIEPIHRLVEDFEKANVARNDKLGVYLESLQSAPTDLEEYKVTDEFIKYVWQVWEVLRNSFLEMGLCLDVPDASLGESGSLMYVWSKGEHYLECEIFPSREIEFFYRNRTSQGIWGEDITFETGFSNKIIGKLSLFAW